MKENLSTSWATAILICGGPDYAGVYPGAILIALNVVLPELWFAPPIVILILLLSSRYYSRVLPVARLRKIDSHCVVMPSPAVEMLYQAVKYHTSAPL